MDESPRAGAVHTTMADRSSARAFGRAFIALAAVPCSPERNRVVRTMLQDTHDFDFAHYQMGDAALAALRAMGAQMQDSDMVMPNTPADDPVSTLQTTPHRIPRVVIDSVQAAAGEALIAFVVELTRIAIREDVSDDERDLLFRTFAYDAAGALKPIARMMRVVPGVADVLPAQLREVMSEARGTYGMEIVDATLSMFAEPTPAPQPSLPLALAAPLSNEKGPDRHKLHKLARAARMFQEIANGPDAPSLSDEMLLRAAVAYGMLARRSMLSPTLDAMGEQHAIALIAANFADDPPSTPHRAALFAMKLDEVPRV